MKLSERLSFVIPLYDDEDKIYAYVHSTPISHDVFKANFWLISRTYAAITEGGLGPIAGPKVAALVLDDVAKQMAGERGDPNSVSSPLLQEVRRLSTVIMPGKNGWDTMPYQVARDRGTVSAEDASEVESAIAFFTCGWFMYPKTLRNDLLSGAAQLWSARISSLNVTEFIASLRTSTETESSGEASTAITVAS